MGSVYDIIYNFFSTCCGSTIMATQTGQLIGQYFSYAFVIGFILFTLKFAKYLLYGLFGK